MRHSLPKVGHSASIYILYGNCAIGLTSMIYAIKTPKKVCYHIIPHNHYSQHHCIEQYFRMYKVIDGLKLTSRAN